MRKTRNALLGILTMMSGAILAVPTEAAERYVPGVYVYKAGPERWFSYPYGGSYLRRGKLPYVNVFRNQHAAQRVTPALREARMPKKRPDKQQDQEEPPVSLGARHMPQPGCP